MIEFSPRVALPGGASADQAAPGQQRLHNAQTSRQLEDFLRSLPTDRFPVLAAIGEQIWTIDRDVRFTASMNAIITGLRSARDPLAPEAGNPQTRS
jgi:hypothetical protein